MMVPRTELRMAFRMIYEEYRKAITAPRAETSVYLVAVKGHWRVHLNESDRLAVVTSSKGGLNVCSQRTIPCGPAVGDRDEGCGCLPSPADILLGNSTVERQCPDDVESESIDAEPRNLGNFITRGIERG